MPTPGDTICGEIHLERLASASLGAEVFQPVFVARPGGQDDSVLLTVVDGGFTPTGVDLSTFMAGANVLMTVRHPALVRVVLVDREEDYCVVGYEDLPGAEPLLDLIVRGGSRRLLARAALEVARGLAFLHRRELLHGALTAGTVLLWEGAPVLWEHGLAGLCDPAAFGPRARSLGGDVVAPEVPSGAPLTPAVDVYAWGAVMASIASGELGSEAVEALLEGDVEPERQGPLLDVIRQALSVDPADRPRDGVHLLELLQRAVAGDPVVNAERAEPVTQELSSLAQRYLDEVAQPPEHAADSWLTDPDGDLGPSIGAGRPWLAEGASGQAEAEAPPPGSPQGEIDDGGWAGRYKLPSGTYAAIRDAPKPAGDGAVRGPEPGGAGVDAGAMAVGSAPASESGTTWGARAGGRSASQWLRAAPPKAADGGVGGLFERDKWLRERPQGLTKRFVLTGEGPPPASSGDAPPPVRAAIPNLADDEDTPPEGIDLGDLRARDSEDMRIAERETPPHVDIVPSRRGRKEREEPDLDDVVDDEDLPPLPVPSLPRASAAGAAAAPAAPRGRVQSSFRPPRLPGPHGPPTTVMAVALLVVAGGLAIASTLSASSARGGLTGLWPSSGSSPAVAAEPTDAAAPTAEVAAGPCPEGMVPIADDRAPFCIDRAEYPGVDLVPATDVDLAHAVEACAARSQSLCTEAQWSRACSGPAGWRFPYGPEREAGRCRVGEPDARPGPSGTDPHCISAEGVLDMVGNAAEWTAEGVVLGGSIRAKKTSACSTRQKTRGSTKEPVLGFRCCAPLADDASAAAPSPAG